MHDSWIKNRGEKEDKESLSWIKDETKSHVVMLYRGTLSGGPSQVLVASVCAAKKAYSAIKIK